MCKLHNKEFNMKLNRFVISVVVSWTVFVFGQPDPISISRQFEKHFQEAGIEGSIIIMDAASQQTYDYNAPRNQELFRPASSFKIFNSLVALESGAVASELELLTWDGLKRGPPGTPDLAAWNRDLNLKEAYRASAIWFYQVLARRAGYDVMNGFIEQAQFGNRQIGTPEKIDSFWLDGDLRISPRQYITFLENLNNNTLPFSEATLNLVKDIMIMERTPDYILRGKTGWDWESDPNVGWFVGYLEQKDTTYLFALTVDLLEPSQLGAREQLVRKCLAELGVP